MKKLIETWNFLEIAIVGVGIAKNINECIPCITANEKNGQQPGNLLAKLYYQHSALTFSQFEDVAIHFPYKREFQSRSIMTIHFLQIYGNLCKYKAIISAKVQFHSWDEKLVTKPNLINIFAVLRLWPFVFFVRREL